MFGIKTYRRIKHISASVSSLTNLCEEHLRDSSERQDTMGSKLNLILANVQMTHSLTTKQIRAQNRILEMYQALAETYVPLHERIELANLMNAAYKDCGVDKEVPMPEVKVSFEDSVGTFFNYLDTTMPADGSTPATPSHHHIPDQAAIDHGLDGMFGIGREARAIARPAPNTGEQITKIIPGDSDADGSK